MNNYKIVGVVKSGLGVANNTIKLQKSFFKEKILEFDKFYLGTMNLDINPILLKPLKFDYYFKNISWCDTFCENFGFSKICIRYKNKSYDGYLYFPSESLHFKNKEYFDYLEIICEKINELKVEDNLEIYIDKSKFEFKN